MVARACGVVALEHSRRHGVSVLDRVGCVASAGVPVWLVAVPWRWLYYRMCTLTFWRNSLTVEQGWSLVTNLRSSVHELAW